VQPVTSRVKPRTPQVEASYFRAESLNPEVRVMNSGVKVMHPKVEPLNLRILAFRINKLALSPQVERPLPKVQHGNSRHPRIQSEKEL